MSLLQIIKKMFPSNNSGTEYFAIPLEDRLLSRKKEPSKLGPAVDQAKVAKNAKAYNTGERKGLSKYN